MKSPNTKAMKNDLHLDLITLNSLPPRSPLGSVLNNGIKKLRTSCWYTEATYDIMPLIWRDRTQWLAVFFRHEQCDTVAVGPTGFDSDGLYDRWICQAGLTYKSSPNILIKADYGNIRFAVPPWGRFPTNLVCESVSFADEIFSRLAVRKHISTISTQHPRSTLS